MSGILVVHIFLENRGASLLTWSCIWVREEHLLVKKVKTQSLQAASSLLHLAVAKTSWH